MRLKIFGERNTSTNAVRAVFKQSFPGVQLLPATVIDLEPKARQHLANIGGESLPKNNIQMLVPAKEAYIDGVFSKTGIVNAWKHCATRFSEESLPDDVHVILMTRHPMSWLLALHRKPYHALQTIEPHFENFLTQPWQTVERDRLNSVVISPVELWNQKLLSYVSFIQRYEYTKRVYVVKFEDFANSQSSALSAICHNMDLDSEQLIELQRSAKGEDKDSAWYRDYYQFERWRTDVSDTAWDILAQQLNKEVSSYFGYVI